MKIFEHFDGTIRFPISHHSSVLSLDVENLHGVFCPGYNIGRGVLCLRIIKHVVVFVHICQNRRGELFPRDVLSYTSLKELTEEQDVQV